MIECVKKYKIVGNGGDNCQHFYINMCLKIKAVLYRRLNILIHFNTN